MQKHNEKHSQSISKINLKKVISCYQYSFLEFLATKSKFFYNLITKWRTPLNLAEIKMANIKSTDKVLHIGCGTIPSESIIIAEQTKATVVGIDNNKNAVKFAKKIVAKKGLSDLIKIEYCEGEEYPIQDFDVIVVAINVWPIEKVLTHLSKQMKKDARIICKGMKDGIIDCIEKSSLSDILSVKSVTPTPKMQSLLIVKKS